MIRLAAQIDSNLAKVAGRHLPFAVSKALNRTAVEARDAVREQLPKRFKLRNNWTKGGIQARTSTKTDLVARVLAPEYMLIQETGGTRQPTKSKLLAAPTEALQGNSPIAKARRPRALISSGKAFAMKIGGSTALFERYGKKRDQIRLLYWFTEDQQYEERFEFVPTVNAKVSQRFSVNFAAAVAESLT